jgi:hypothetical protein
LAYSYKQAGVPTGANGPQLPLYDGKTRPLGPSDHTRELGNARVIGHALNELAEAGLIVVGLRDKPDSHGAQHPIMFDVAMAEAAGRAS